MTTSERKGGKVFYGWWTIVGINGSMVNGNVVINAAGTASVRVAGGSLTRTWAT